MPGLQGSEQLYADALATLEKARKLDAQSESISYQMAVTYASIHRFPEATQVCDEALRLSTRRDDVYFHRGVILLEQSEARLAEESFRQALASNPGVASYHAARGLALFQMGNLAESQHELDAALRLDPQGGSAYPWRARVLAKKGQITQAITDYETYITLVPDTPKPYEKLEPLYRQGGKPEKAAAVHAKYVSLKAETEETERSSRRALVNPNPGRVSRSRFGSERSMIPAIRRYKLMFGLKARARVLTCALTVVLLFTVVMAAYAQIGPGAVSLLTARGYSVLPVPQKVTVGPQDFEFSDGWQLVADSGIQTTDIAIESLKDQFAERCHLRLSESGSETGRTGVVRLSMRPRAVTIGDATDRNRVALAEQAYQLVLKPQKISLRANAAPGLFYGVQTLVQLLTDRHGRWMLPEGEIVDWPDLELRIIYWDDAHHVEPLAVLKQGVRQASFYKINGFSLKLEGHFEYKSAAPIVEPYALSPSELQELTDFSLKYHVQVIPYLDAPAHISFILKHPEYATLREFPERNYEACVTNPATYKLYSGMFQDLLDANKGAKYFVLSTDEPYYVGLAKNDQCNELDRARELGSVGKLLGRVRHQNIRILTAVCSFGASIR
jgi:Flp pilus assembly protein TadD